MSNTSSTASGFQLLKKQVKTFVPIFQWLPEYRFSFLGLDLLAGLTLAFFVMPESLAYAALAGVPPQYGVYCTLAGGLFFAFFSSSKQVAVGPTSAISLMIGTTVATMAGGDMARWLEISMLTALFVGLLGIVAFILKLSSVVSFISESILLGFKAGAAFYIAASQLPKLFGIEGTTGSFFDKIANVVTHLNETNPTTLILGIIAFAVLYIGTKILPGKPVSLVVIIVSILLITYSSLSSFGIHLTGNIPSGLPYFGKPSLELADMNGILGLALACFLMGYIETVSAARSFAQKNDYKIDARQELLSMGMANIASAFAGGYPVAGGLSQSTVNDKAGAKTPMALIICTITLAVLLFFTELLANLPEVILAVIVFDAILGLIKIKALKRLYYLSRLEFAVAMVTFGAVLFFGILNGILLAAIISIVLIIRQTAHPIVTLLGRVQGTQLYSDIERHPDNETFDGLLIVRVQSSFFYFNVENISNDIWIQINKAPKPVKMVIINMSSSPYVDVAGSDMIMQLYLDLNKKGINLRVVEAYSFVRDILRKRKIENFMGHISRHVSCDDAVKEFLESNKKTT